MKAVKIHTPKPETRLPAHEQAARERRASTARTPTLPGTRQPTPRRAAAPRARTSTTPVLPQD